MLRLVDPGLIDGLFMVSLLGGAFGAVLVLFLLVIVRSLCAGLVLVRSLKRATAVVLEFPPLPGKLQTGSARTALLALVAVVALSLLACAAPPAHYSDAHGVWLEHVKKGGW